MSKQHHKYYLAGSVALITFIIYLSSLGNQFVNWDDPEYVIENPYIRSFDLNLFKWAFFDFYAANWHPLTWISHALDYAVWGLDPLGHHLTNNILHAVNTFLVVLLVVRLLETVSPSSRLIPSSHRNHDSPFHFLEKRPLQKDPKLGTIQRIFAKQSLSPPQQQDCSSVSIPSMWNQWHGFRRGKTFCAHFSFC